MTAGWDLATVTSDKPVSSYVVQFYYNTTSSWPSPVSSYTFGTPFTGLANSATSQISTTPTIGYYYGARVYASNVIGSNSASNDTLVQYGSAPTAATITSLTSNTNSITVTWTVNNTADRVASSYNISDGVNATSNTVSYSYSSPSYSFEMTETTSATYTFTVISVNAINSTNSATTNISWAPLSYAPTSPSIGTVSASGATASWTVPNGPGYSPSSYTVLIYEDSTSSVSTSSTLFATKPNQTSGSSISFSATSVNYYAIVVVAVYTGIISTSMQYILPPTFNSVSASWFYGTTQSGTPSFNPSSSAPTQIDFNFVAGDGSINTANNLKIIFNGAGGVQNYYAWF